MAEIMNISSTTAGTAAAAAAQTSDSPADRKLRQATKDFEAVFMSYLLKTMKGESGTNEMFGESFGGDMMDGIFNFEMAKQISRSSHNGIADMLYRQLTGRNAAAPADQSKVAEKASVSAGSAGNTAAVPVPARTELEERVSQYNDSINAAAEQYGLDPNLLKAMIACESGGNPRAASSRDAKGLMQLIDSTAASVGVGDVWDPQQNIAGGAKYMKSLLDRFQGDVRLALAAYNAGPGAVEKFDNVPPYRETESYVTRVMNYINYFGQSEK